MGKDVIIACDFPNKKTTLDFLDKFTGRKPYVKIGMELFYAEGPDIVREIKGRGHKIFLDLKLHDIPNTVEKAMASLSGLGVDMTNVHAAGTRDMMEAALRGLTRPDGSRPILIAVTQLTSTSQERMQKELLIDGQAAPANWLSHIGYVPQEIFLSDDTIGANIALGLTPQAEALEKAALAAQLQEFLGELPQRFETPLGERGASLSGGQRQRIGIARALYQKPQLLIFDEATSALDELTQRNLLESLRQLGDLTVVVIAHRLEVIRDCDRIVMLENGRALAQGSYAELLENCPAFAQMVSGS